ncbi:DNA-binding domain-containing protein [Thalassobaculum sp.]|uniref:DNA-binding domain-containing protein n=1 Tax=Thalassobaculum sp. TaxID=2022740 RepID=UPI0032F04B7E
MAESATLAAFAAALADPGRPPPPGLSARPGADPVRRFAVYRNNLATGLIDALRAGFPVTERIVGEDFFRAMARAFAAGHRPDSPLLFEYGAAFPGFVAGFEPAADLPYLGGVAAVEAARTGAYHAADAPTIGIADLAGRLADRGGDDLLAVRVVPHPAARLVASRYPAVAIWAAHQGGGMAPAFAGPWRPETALVTRPADAVEVRALDPAAGAFAAALLAGAGVGEAGALALREDDGFEAGGALVALVEAGAVAGLAGTDEQGALE